MMAKLKTKREIREWLNTTVADNLPILWQEKVIDPKHPFFIEPQTFGEEQLVTLVRCNDADYEEDETEKIFLIKPYNMYVKVTREKIKVSYQCTYQTQYKAEEVEPYEFKETRFKTKVVDKQLAVAWIKEKLANKDFLLFHSLRRDNLRNYILNKQPYDKEEWETPGDYYSEINSQTKKLQEDIIDYLDIEFISYDCKTIIKIGELNKFYWLRSEDLVEVKPVEQTVTNYVPVVAT